MLPGRLPSPPVCSPLPKAIPITRSEPDSPEGLENAVRLVHGIIDRAVESGIPAERVVIGGFSQGGFLAVYAGLTYKQKLGGLVSFSGWAARKATVAAEAGVNKDTPLLSCGGDADQVVVITAEAGEFWKTFMSDVRTRTYRGLPHSHCPEEDQELFQFLNEVLPPV